MVSIIENAFSTLIAARQFVGASQYSGDAPRHIENAAKYAEAIVNAVAMPGFTVEAVSAHYYHCVLAECSAAMACANLYQPALLPEVALPVTSVGLLLTPTCDYSDDGSERPVVWVEGYACGDALHTFTSAFDACGNTAEGDAMGIAIDEPDQRAELHALVDAYCDRLIAAADREGAK